MDRIKNASSFEEVLALVQQHRQCSIRELTTAINCMAKRHMACERGGAGSAEQQAAQLAANRVAFGQLADLALERLAQFTSVTCAQLFWAAAKMQAQLAPKQQAAWEARTVPLLPEAEPQSVSLILWAYGTQQQLGSMQPGSSMLTALPRVLADEPASPQAVANGLWGWGKLGLSLTEQLENAAAAGIQRTAAGMTPQAVANTLWTYATSGWQLSSEAAAALAEQLPRLWQHGDPQAVANSLWAWARLGQQLDGELAEAADAAIQCTAADMLPVGVSQVLVAFASGEGWPQLSSEAASALRLQLPRVLQVGDPQQVSNCLWGWSKLGLPFNRQLAAAATKAIQRTAADMTSQAVSSTLWAHANGGWQLSSEAAAALAKQLVQALQDGEPQHVANSLWAWSKLKQPLAGSLATAAAAGILRTAADMIPQQVASILCAYANGGWLLSSEAAAVLAQQMLQVLQHGDPQAVGNSLWGWSRLGQQLDGELKAAADAAIQRTAASISLQGLSNTLWAYATSGWQLSGRAAAALAQQLPRVLQDGNPQDVANSLWGWSKLGLSLDRQLAAAADAAIQRMPAEMLPIDIAQVLYAFANGVGWPQLSGEAAAALRAQLPRVLAALQQGDAQAVSNSLWAWGKLELPVDRVLVQAATAAVLRAAPAVGPEDVSQVSWAHQHGGWQLSAAAMAAVSAAGQRLRKSGEWRDVH